VRLQLVRGDGGKDGDGMTKDDDTSSRNVLRRVATALMAPSVR
jgi:hypothetical protein